VINNTKLVALWWKADNQTISLLQSFLCHLSYLTFSDRDLKCKKE
jgi:hypothetical protein